MDSRQLLPLAILDAADGEVDGRTRLIKLVFLAQKEAEEPLPEEYNFEPYQYGPFTSNLLHDLDYLEDRKSIIQSKEATIPNGKKYTYVLNERYRGSLKEELFSEFELSDEEWDRIESQATEITQKFNTVPISRLLEHVYNKYAEYTTESVI